MISTLRILTTLLFFSIILFGCSSQDKSTLGSSTAQEISVDLSQNSSDTVVLDLKAVGNTMMEMKYDKDIIKVKQGSIVKIMLYNEGKDQTMHHNVVIIKKGSLEKVGTQAARVGAKRSYVPDIPEVIAASEMAKPGETIEFVFPAPPAGSYVFACTYPGHYMKMKGRFIVVE